LEREVIHAAQKTDYIVPLVALITAAGEAAPDPLARVDVEVIPIAAVNRARAAILHADFLKAGIRSDDGYDVRALFERCRVDRQGRLGC
jgi:threonyl-tRNA synthetase